MKEIVKTKKFLIIEDSKFINHILKTFFQGLQAQADFITDLENEEKISSAAYDILLLDIVIDKKTTINLIPRLKKENPNLVIIVISSYTEMLEENPKVSDAIDYIISKPFTEFQLRELFGQILVPQNNRVSPRKAGFPQCWVARYNKKIGRAEIFESPYLLNISETGLAFESFFQYEVNEELIIWLLLFEKDKKHILELRGNLVWRKEANDNKFSYGVHFIGMSEENNLYFRHYIKNLK